MWPPLASMSCSTYVGIDFTNLSSPWNHIFMVLEIKRIIDALSLDFRLFSTIDHIFFNLIQAGWVPSQTRTRILCIWKDTITILDLWHGVKFCLKIPFLLGLTFTRDGATFFCKFLDNLGNSSRVARCYEQKNNPKA